MVVIHIRACGLHSAKATSQRVLFPGHRGLLHFPPSQDLLHCILPIMAPTILPDWSKKLDVPWGCLISTDRQYKMANNKENGKLFGNTKQNGKRQKITHNQITLTNKLCSFLHISVWTLSIYVHILTSLDRITQTILHSLFSTLHPKLFLR